MAADRDGFTPSGGPDRPDAITDLFDRAPPLRGVDARGKRRNMLHVRLPDIGR